MRKTYSLAILLLAALASSSAMAANKVNTHPSQMKPPTQNSGTVAPTAQIDSSTSTSSTAAKSAEKEAERVERIKQEIINNRSKDPVLDKLGPYLGKGY